MQVLNTLPKVGQDTPLVEGFINLFRNIREAVANDVNPKSEQGQQLAERWFRLASELYGEHADLANKVYQTYRTKKENLGFVYLDEEIISFIEAAYDQRVKGDVSE